MSYCPRGDDTEVTQYTTTSKKPEPVTQPVGTPGTKTVNPPEPRNENCDPSKSKVVEGPGNVNPAPDGGNSGTDTTNTETKECPGKQGLGFKWAGYWSSDTEYKAQSDDNPSADVVHYLGNTYVAIVDNTGVTPSDISSDWQLFNSGIQEEESFLGKLIDNVWDWAKDASVGELITAGAGVAGVIWAGNEIIESIMDDGTGDGKADQRYTGSDGITIKNYTPPTIKQVLKELCDYAGIKCDVSKMGNDACEFTIGNSTSVRSIIEVLSLSYQFDIIEYGGVYKFVPRTTVSVKTIDSDDLAFSTDEFNPSSPYYIERAQGITLPKRVTLTYFDPNLEYDTFTQQSESFVYEEGQDVVLNTPVTLSAARAKEIAELTMVNAHLEREKFTFTTSYKHIDLDPSDVIYNEDMGLIRITRISETDEGIIELEAVTAGVQAPTVQARLMSANILEVPESSVIEPPVNNRTPKEVGYSQALFIDPPALDDSDTGIRIYAAVHGYDKPNWPGAQIFVSENDGLSYDYVTTAVNEATIGIVELPTPAADYHLWDEVTEIVVKLKTNMLNSVSELDVCQGKNWCMVGQEVIGFKNAQLIAPMTYKLSGLMRGRRGSEQYVTMHKANELFVMLDENLTRLDYKTNDRSTIKKYKVVTVGSSVDKAKPIDVQMYSNNTLSWPVTNAKVVKHGNDYTFSWKESVRFDEGLRDFIQAFHDDDWGGYGVVIYANDGVTQKATYTTQSETWTYTSDMQRKDFGTTVSNVKAAVVQLSKKWGAGYPVAVNS